MNNFTPRAQQVLALARKEADQMNHNFVGTEHLLLGLIRLGQGTAVTVLQKLGVNLETARQEVKRQLGPGPESKTPTIIPYTPRVKMVLANAAKEAKALGHTYIGTEHLLLGLLSEGDGPACKVLVELGVEIDKTREGILHELGHPRPHAAPKPVAVVEPSVDVSQRYDIYCDERGRQVVYRNVLLKPGKTLLPGIYTDETGFFQIEQEDGQRIFIAYWVVIKFCATGVTPKSEPVSPEPAKP